jgi:hypothetical protein
VDKIEMLRRRVYLASCWLLLVVLTLVLHSYFIDPWNERLSIAPTFHLTVGRLEDNGQLIAFNNSNCAIVNGVTAMVGPDGTLVSFVKSDTGWQHFGIHYRCIVDRVGERHWSLCIPLWMAGVGTLPGILWKLAASARRDEPTPHAPEPSFP